MKDKKSQIFVIEADQGKIGKDPSERTIPELLNSGIVNVDKASGPSSHQISAYVQKIFKIKKSGHSGTLDPKVTGVQPIALGRATKVTQFLLTAPKEYVCLMHLHKQLSSEKIQEAINQFIGKIKQLPPIKSAVKRQERVREIYELEILEIKGQDVLFRVKCQAGTYIRKLCHDIGQTLGSGAHMAQLRRTQAGPFTEKDNLITLNDLKDAFHYYQAAKKSDTEKNDAKKNVDPEKFLRYCIQPVENAVSHLPKAWIFDSALLSLSHGRDLASPGISKLENFKKDQLVAIMSLKNELVAIGTAQMSAVEINTKRRGIAVSTSKVFFTMPTQDIL